MPRRSVAFTGIFELRFDANLYGFCPAWLSDLSQRPPALTNRGNPQHGLFPGIPFGLSVLPTAAIPPCPTRGPQPLGYRLLFGSTTPRRTGSIDPACLTADKQKSAIL